MLRNRRRAEFRLSLDSTPGFLARLETRESRISLRRKVALSVLGAVAVCFVLGFVLAQRRGEFTAALESAPIWLLSLPCC